MKVTIEEAKKFVQEADNIDFSSEIDDCGNEWSTNIYEKDGKLYAIDYCNGKFSRRSGSNETEIREVKERIEIEKVHYYDDIEDNPTQ